MSDGIAEIKGRPAGRFFFVEELSARSSVMLGPVPSICDVSIYDRLADPRHKATVVRFKFADKAQDSHSNRFSGFSP